MLLDRCGDPECGKTAWTATLGIDRCEHCMTDLTKVKSIRVREGAREALAEFGGMFSHDPSVRAATLAFLPNSVARLGPANVIDLLLRVIPVVDSAIPTDVANILKAPPHALCASVAVSWKALKTWPVGLAEIAADRVATRVGRHNDGNDGRTMRFLARRCQVAAPQGVLDLIDDWRRSISVDEADGAPLLHQTMSGIAVTNATRLDTGRLVKYRRAGLFKVHFALDAQRPEARYDTAEIMSMAAVLADRSSIGGARLALGIPSHGVEQLIAMRLLDTLELALVDASFGEQQVSQRSLDALVESIRPTPGGANARDMMTLRSAMKAIGGRIKPWGPVFALLVAGELPIIIDPIPIP